MQNTCMVHLETQFNPETTSDAMVILHEYGHTTAGGDKKDLNSRTGDDTRRGGYNEGPRHLNAIRRQMSRKTGLSWGKRRTYFTYSDGTGRVAIAFNGAARRYMRRFGTPPPFLKKYKFVIWTP
jgi:hypothetical protein